MSCIHIQGTRRAVTDCPPFRFTGKRDRVFEIEQNAKHENARVRAAAAAHPMAPEHVLKTLAWDSDLEVRQWVARNPRCPAGLLEWLAVSKDATVRTFVAWNPNTPLVWIKYLAENDADETVRNMAQNVLDNQG